VSRGQLPPHCAAHRLFPLPCAACHVAANPLDMPVAPSSLRMKPAATTGNARAGRLANEVLAAERRRAAS